uniref:Cytochrome b561 domain-containing protein n=1 Tax=Bursaphelenchus xylophilus TaxID=6326 RepID=A0A1I7SSJ6_BURXY
MSGGCTVQPGAQFTQVRRSARCTIRQVHRSDRIRCKDYNAYFQQLHTILGTIIGSLVISQIVAGYCRPSVSAVSRKAWNLLHTFTGYIIYIGFSANAFIGVQLQKIGLTEYYGRLPVYILIVGLSVTIIMFICCEWIVHSEKFLARDPDRIERFYNPAEEQSDEIPEQNIPKTPMILILFNLITGIMVVLSLTIMVVKASRLKGFNL